MHASGTVRDEYNIKALKHYGHAPRALNLYIIFEKQNIHHVKLLESTKC